MRALRSGALLLGIPFVILFLIAGGGAGDAKMMAAIGAWVGAALAALYGFKHAFCFIRIPGKWLRADDSLFMFTAQQDSCFMQIIWKCNAYNIYFWSGNRSFHIDGAKRCFIILHESIYTLLAT